MKLQTFATFCNAPLTPEEDTLVQDTELGEEIASNIKAGTKTALAFAVTILETHLSGPDNTLDLGRPNLKEHDIRILQELAVMMTSQDKELSEEEFSEDMKFLNMAMPVVERLQAYQRQFLKALEQSMRNISKNMEHISFVFLEGCAQHDTKALAKLFPVNEEQKNRDQPDQSPDLQTTNVFNLIGDKSQAIEVKRLANKFNGVTSLDYEHLTDDQISELPPLWHDQVYARSANRQNIRHTKTIIGFLDGLRQAMLEQIAPIPVPVHKRPRHSSPPQLSLVAKP